MVAGILEVEYSIRQKPVWLGVSEHSRGVEPLFLPGETPE